MLCYALRYVERLIILKFAYKRVPETTTNWRDVTNNARSRLQLSS
jgi:hypothetical protein